MGCEASSPQGVQSQDQHGNTQGSKRLSYLAAYRLKQEKKRRLQNKLHQETENIDNVTDTNETISNKQKEMLDKIISQHFLLYKLTSEQRVNLIDKMKVCETKQEEYVFKHGDPASSFYIIKQGSVAIEINGEQVKSLGPASYFGELALLYSAPRSASVRAETPCKFWSLSQGVFRQNLKIMVEQNYKLAKTYLNKITYFSFLMNKQKDFIAYNMHTLKYQENQYIFKEGDDATSFYLIVSGEVEIEVPDKESIILKSGESFGESSFKPGEYRTGSARCLKKSHFLVIGREDLKNCIGGRSFELLFYNKLKWIFKRSKYFESWTIDKVEKLIMSGKIRKEEAGSILNERQNAAKNIFISLEGEINESAEQKIFFEDQLTKKDQNPTENELIKNTAGYIFKCEISKVQKLAASIRNSSSINQMMQDELEVMREFRQKSRNNKTQLSGSLKDLTMMKLLGNGQFGEVYLVNHPATKKQYALKIIKKQLIIQQEMQDFLLSEKAVMEEISHPFIVNLEKTYKDDHFYYFLMGFIEGGDFFDILREIGIGSNSACRFYTACLLHALEHLHSKKIIYRDLKPQNTVVDKNGYLSIIDLGTAKKLSMDDGSRTFTMIGTPHYMAPEIMGGKGYSFSVDIWALGVMLYEIGCGKLPYGEHLEDPFEIYDEVQKSELKFPKHYSDPKGKEMILKMMKKEQLVRDSIEIKDLKTMPFFEKFKWVSLLKKELKSPYIPKPRDLVEKSIYGIQVAKFMEKQKVSTPPLPSAKGDWDEQF